MQHLLRSTVLRYFAAYQQMSISRKLDLTHSEALWKILRLGFLQGLLVYCLAFIMGLGVKCGGGMASFFTQNTGMRQGCILVPSLFNTGIDWILGWAVGQSHCGEPIENPRVSDLMLADDAAILDEPQRASCCSRDSVRGSSLWDSRSPEPRPRYRYLKTYWMTQYSLFMHVERTQKSWKNSLR